jgi:hypothetical protein
MVSRALIFIVSSDVGSMILAHEDADAGDAQAAPALARRA